MTLYIQKIIKMKFKKMIATKIWFIFVIFLLVDTINLQGQSQPKKIILSGSSSISGQFLDETYSFGSNNPTELKTTQFNFQPSIGIFLSYFIRLGIYTDYLYNNQKNGNYYSKSVSTSVGPYFRVYFNDYKISPFINAKLGYSRLKIDQKEDNNSYDDILKGMNYGLGLGLEYYIGRKYSFELLLDYNVLNVSCEKTKNSSWPFFGQTSYSESVKRNGFKFNIGVNLFLN